MISDLNDLASEFEQAYIKAQLLERKPEAMQRRGGHHD